MVQEGEPPPRRIAPDESGSYRRLQGEAGHGNDEQWADNGGGTAGAVPETESHGRGGS